MTNSHYKDLLLHATDITEDIQRKYLASGFDAKSKYGKNRAVDVVTEADLECEDVLRELFAKELPDFNIFGEERGAAYNGNGKVIIIDPIDGTLSYTQGVPYFGTIISLYENKIPTAGIISNTLQGNTYLGINGQYSKIDKRNRNSNDYLDVELIKNVIYLGGWSEELNDMLIVLESRLQEAFPKSTVLKKKQDIHGRCHVYDGEWTGYIHSGLAVHDISVDGLFGKLTNTNVTDHKGNPYWELNPEAEVEKYKIGTSKALYSNPLVVARPEVHKKFIEILDEFKDVYDNIQNPGHP